MNTKSKLTLGLAGIITALTALAHMSCIVLGSFCYRAQLAPEELINLAATGSPKAAVATLIVSSLFVGCTLFAFSAAGFIKKLPLLKSAILIISFICTLRGVATVPLSLKFPEMVSTTSILSGIIWFITGVLFFYGYLSMKKGYDEELSNSNN